MIDTEITLLNGMLGHDFARALDHHQELGVYLLDLKDAIFGKSFSSLTLEEARDARRMIEKRGLKVYTLSSSLCHEDIEKGEADFRESTEAEMTRVLTVAEILRPDSIRLLSAWSSQRPEFSDSIAYITQRHPWVFDVYRECIDRIASAGYAAFIENESERNIFSNTEEILGFFMKLNRTGKVRFTWDIQNLWQMGTFPSLPVYEELRELIGYLHFKGGRCGADRKLAWASSLAEASWPVSEIVRRAVVDGTAPVFCLNPSHGARQPDFDSNAVTVSDLLFLRELIENA